METVPLVILLCAAVLLCVWFSMIMSSVEVAVGRVTRANLNNMILDIRTSDQSHFSQMKKIDRIHCVQKLIANRFATAGSCFFFRVIFTVFSGVLVSCIANLIEAQMWVQFAAGLAFSFIFAVISVVVRPRTKAVNRPVQAILRYSRVISIAVKLTPFAKISSKRRRQIDNLSDEEELEKIHLEQEKAAIDRIVESDDFDPETSEMLKNVLSMQDTLTREIMVPRTDMFCMERDVTLDESLRMFCRSGFSRVAVIDGSVDEIIGVAYLKDVVRQTAFNKSAGNRSIETVVREPMFVPESKPADDLFHEMQQCRQHVAIVADEYGGIAGMVTIEDAIEQIVGELEDEHDRVNRSEPVKVGDYMWKVPARTPIADIEEIFDLTIDETDVDTAYGLLTKILGHVPIVGSSATDRGLRFTAIDSAGRRKKVSTILVEPAAADSASSEFLKYAPGEE